MEETSTDSLKKARRALNAGLRLQINYTPFGTPSREGNKVTKIPSRHTDASINRFSTSSV